MEVMYESVGGLDVHKQAVVACVRRVRQTRPMPGLEGDCFPVSGARHCDGPAAATGPGVVHSCTIGSSGSIHLTGSSRLMVQTCCPLGTG